MAKRVGVDKWLFGVTVLLVFIGLLMVFSASAVMAEDRYGSPYTFVSKQIGWAVLGLLTMIVLMRIDYRKFNRPIVVFPAVAITTLLLLGVFLLRDSHNTHRWIRFGGSLSFQPSEIAKPVLVLFLAWFLQDKLHSIRDWRNTLLPAALPTLLFILLIVKEPDLGTALVCAAVAALMFYLAGAELKYLGYAVLAAAPVLYILLFRVPWRRARMLAFMNPEADPQGSGFHTIQSLIAVGTGGHPRAGLHGRAAKALLFAAAAYRLHLCQYRGGARPHRRPGHHCPVRCPWVSWAAGCQPFQGCIRALSGFRHYGNHPHPGLL